MKVVMHINELNTKISIFDISILSCQVTPYFIYFTNIKQQYVFMFFMIRVLKIKYGKICIHSASWDRCLGMQSNFYELCTKGLRKGSIPLSDLSRKNFIKCIILILNGEYPSLLHWHFI